MLIIANPPGPPFSITSYNIIENQVREENYYEVYLSFKEL